MKPVLEAVLLGSGTSTGVPVAACRCAVCTSDDPRNRRTRCSVLLTFAERNVLIDTATDLRQQILREKIDRIDAVLYTHPHADHLHGIDDLRPFSAQAPQPIPLYGDAATLAQIRTTFAYIFSDDIDPGYRPRLETRAIDGPFGLFGERIVPVPLIHGAGASLGYRIGSFAYLTDCSAIPPTSQKLLHGLEVLVIDGLRFTPHTTHFHIAGAIEAARRLGARRTVLTHLSHDVDYGRDSAALPPGVELAFDGLRFRLPLTSCPDS